jgi:hypothetical protein
VLPRGRVAPGPGCEGGPIVVRQQKRIQYRTFLNIGSNRWRHGSSSHSCRALLVAEPSSRGQAAWRNYSLLPRIAYTEVVLFRLGLALRLP